MLIISLYILKHKIRSKFINFDLYTYTYSAMHLFLGDSARTHDIYTHTHSHRLELILENV